MVFLSLITRWFGELAAVHRKYHTYLTLLPSALVTPPSQGQHKINYVQRRRWRKALCFWCFFSWMALHKLPIESCWQQIGNSCHQGFPSRQEGWKSVLFTSFSLKPSSAPYSYQEVIHPIPPIRRLLFSRVPYWYLSACQRCLLPLVLPWLSYCSSSAFASPLARGLRVLQCVMSGIKVSRDINALDKHWAQELCSYQSYHRQAARGK